MLLQDDLKHKQLAKVNCCQIFLVCCAYYTSSEKLKNEDLNPLCINK